MKAISKRVASYIALLALAVGPIGMRQALAATTSIGGLSAPTNQNLGSTTSDFNTSFAAIATTAVNIVLLVSGVLAVLFLIWSGVQYITSAGSAEKAKTARAGIINAVIGIVVIVAAFFIVRFAVSAGNTVSNSAGTNL